MKTKNAWISAITLLLAAATASAAAAQGAANATAGSGAVRVLDANNQFLGTLVGTFPDNFNAINSVMVLRKGHFVTLDFSGKFPVGIRPGTPIFWTQPNCTGGAYLGEQGETTEVSMARNIVIYSAQSNSLYILAGAGVTASSRLVQFQSVEFGGAPDGTSICANNPSTGAGWFLGPFDAATALGWNVSGNPLQVAGPIKFIEP